MIDCVETLHLIMTSPAELAQAQADIAASWRKSLDRASSAPRERFIVTGLAAARHKCLRVRRVILTTENGWSENDGDA